MATKKTATRKRASRSTKAVQMRSFQVSPEPTPFSTFKITRQTLYWVILVGAIVAMQLFIIKQQYDIAYLTEALQISQSR